MILETERLVLTPFSESDGADLYPLMSDDEVMAHLETDGVEDPDEVNLAVAAQAAATASGEMFYWTIRADGVLIGWAQVTECDKRRHQAEIAVMLHRDARGAGYAAEAMAAVVGFAATRGFRRLTARSQVGENRSEALLSRLGFEQLGYVRGQIDRDGERRDWRLWAVEL